MKTFLANNLLCNFNAIFISFSKSEKATHSSDTMEFRTMCCIIVSAVYVVIT